MKYPRISVVIPTYNSEKTLALCLASVRSQNYPQEQIEIILADGGSADSTKDIAKKYKARWIHIDPKKQNVEYNKSTGLQHANGALVLFIDHDNILPNSALLRKMVIPLIKHPALVGVETLRYQYTKDSSLLDRYFALFGVNDPFAFYMGKADRLSYIYDTFPRSYNARDLGDYYVVQFSENHIPTIGANGFLVRKQLLLKHADASPGKYFPIDVNVDLIRKGFNTYAFVKDGIIHLSGFDDAWYYLRRRMLFIKQYHLSSNSTGLDKKRRYSLYEPKDKWKLIWYIIISLTLVVPLIDSFRGYKKIQDPAWFINPFLCFGLVILYGFVILEHQCKLLLKISDSTQ